MREDPFKGDVKMLAPGYYRLRWGSYRILYTVTTEIAFVHVRSIERKGENTYK